MIHVAPGKMISAGHVIEFVAEVSVAIVEIEMQKKIRESKKQDDKHTVREERLFLFVGIRRLFGVDFHLGIFGHE
jgi:hypothetical protein